MVILGRELSQDGGVMGGARGCAMSCGGLCLSCTISKSSDMHKLCALEAAICGWLVDHTVGMQHTHTRQWNGHIRTGECVF